MKIILKIKPYLLAFFTTIALTVNLKTIYYEAIKDRSPFKVDLLFVGIILIFFIIFYKKIKEEDIHVSKKILSIIFTIFLIIGNSYIQMESWNLIFGSPLMFALATITFVSFYALLTRGFMLLDQYLEKLKEKEWTPKNKLLKKFLVYFEEKPFLTSLIVLLLFWLIYIIAFYPIILSPDPSFQIKQALGEYTKYLDWVIPIDPSVTITNHHPVLHTFLLGGSIKLGRLLFGSDNLGLFIYSLVQVFIVATTFANAIKFLKKWNVNSKYRIISLLIFSLVPMFSLYAMSGVKDTIYTALVINYVLFLFDFIKNYQKEKLPLKTGIILTIILILITLFRNNGLYIIIFSFPFIIFYSKRNRLETFMIFVVLLGFNYSYNNILLPHLKITNGSIREVLSIPFQQTARYVKKHSKDLTYEQVEIIDKLLSYDTLASRYEPEISDPVKNEYNPNITDAELKEYFTKVWADGLFKHPKTYIQATINNIYGYFTPNSTNWYIYYKYDKRITQNNLVDYSFNGMDTTRDILSGIGLSFPYIPLVGFIANIGFNTCIIIIIGVYLFTNRKSKYIIPLIPLYVTVLVCVAGPVNTYFRYTMPYVFMVPILIPLFLKIMKKEK